jgi:hypothetical protein
MNKTVKYVVGVLVLALLVQAAFLMKSRASKKRVWEEISKTHDAIVHATSFHRHYEGTNRVGGDPNFVEDVWVTCPDLTYFLSKPEKKPGEEFIIQDKTRYSKINGAWVIAPSRNWVNHECDGLRRVVSFGIVLSFYDSIASTSEKLAESTHIDVGKTRRVVGGAPCTDYTFTTHTADVAKRDLVESLCIADDHLPREFKTRYWGAQQDSVTTYEGWNQTDAKQAIPADFSPENAVTYPPPPPDTSQQ